MDLLIKHATVINAESEYHQQTVDILIKAGKIDKIAPLISVDNTPDLTIEGLYVLPGLIDVGIIIGDPGYEHREDLYSANKAAAAGGFTAVACYPNTHPVVDSKSGIRYIKNNAENLAVDFYPIGAVSEHCDGKDITEMIDMYRSGAIAFSDGLHAIQHNGMMMRALQYVKSFDGLIINHPHDASIAGDGQINEGEVSTMLGMKGIPDMAEELMVHRDIYLAEYTDSRVHLSNVSTKGAVDMIRKAKKEGIKVSASVAAINLCYTDQEVLNFDSNFKILPPLRSSADVLALKEGLKDGTIDFISSNHVPLEEEAKKKEFSFADFGAAGLETSFVLSWQNLKNQFSIEDMERFWSSSPRKLLGLPLPKIEEGAKANFTLFQPEQFWTHKRQTRNSKSFNSPFIDQTFQGAILGIINGQKSEFFDRS